MGLIFENNISASFVNLNIKKVYNILEALSWVSEYIIKNLEPLLIIGESFYKRGFYFNALFGIIKKFKVRSLLLQIKTSCNQEAFELLNISNLSNRTIKNSDFLICIDLEDCIRLKKLLINKKTVIWINSHNSELFKKKDKNNFIKFSI